MIIQANEWKGYFKEIVTMVEMKKDELSELDRSLGDGDHGVTMSIGWQAVNEKLNQDLLDEQDCGKIAMTVGRTFLSAVGSSVGPLYATGFMRGAKAIKSRSELNDSDLAAFWTAFVEGVKERGGARVGDKTMVDTLEPVRESLQGNEGKAAEDFPVAFADAVSEGFKGMESTEGLVSQKGRSSRLGKRSVGHLDPGAVSAYLILSTFLDVVKKNQTVS